MADLQKLEKLEADLLSKTDELKKQFEVLLRAWQSDRKKKELEEIERKLSQESDYKKIAELLKTKTQLEEDLSEMEKIQKMFDDINALFELWKEGEIDALEEARKLFSELERKVKSFRIRTLLSEKYDRNNAIIEITPGAGGTESMDWAAMLMRMYIRWATSKGFEVKILDKMPGEQAGIKSATLLVEGDFAYGLLKGESGIHRLVRISPFDASRRRHTSFAAVTVYPEIDESIEVKIDPRDLVIETFRASGPGGQHVNKTDSAVRIRHIPTGIVVTCQNERSQHRNKQIALKILYARLWELERRKKEEEKQKLMGEKKEIAWGNQIRSYILHPYKLVKDHRTGVEEPLAEKVLDGELDKFIEAYLLWKKEKESQEKRNNNNKE